MKTNEESTVEADQQLNVLVYKPGSYPFRAIKRLLSLPWVLVIVAFATIHFLWRSEGVWVLGSIVGFFLLENLIWTRRCIHRIEFRKDDVLIDFDYFNVENSVVIRYEELQIVKNRIWYKTRANFYFIRIKADGQSILSQYELKNFDTRDMDTIMGKLLYYQLQNGIGVNNNNFSK